MLLHSPRGEGWLAEFSVLRISEFLIFVFAVCNLLDVGKTLGWSWSVVTPQGGGGNKDSGREG